MGLIVAIYQAPFRQTCMGFDPMADYRAVWIEEDTGLDIDQVWTRFQRVEEGIQMPPDGYEGRSLSIGDVVDLRGEFFTPEPVGWRKLNDAEKDAVKSRTVAEIEILFARMRMQGES